MYHFVENSIRGGISMISTRHAQANSPSFLDTYDSSLPNQNLMYLDANNLYGGGGGGGCLNLCPLMDFAFSNRMIFLRLSCKNYPTMLRMVDLHYPTHLHDRHDYYPLSPESLVIDRIMYSSTQQAVFPESFLFF